MLCSENKNLNNMDMKNNYRDKGRSMILPIKENIQGIMAFLFFAFLLSIKSGYNIPAIMSLLIFFVFFKEIEWGRLSRLEVFFAFCFLVFALLWGWGFDNGTIIQGINDYFYKYIIAIFVFIAAIFVKVKKKYYISGLIVGCMLTFCIAAWQFKGVGRAEGFTNAIRFGNLSLWMSCACLIFAMVGESSLKTRVALVVSAMFGIFASFLSLSRGGWVFIFILPFIFFVFYEDKIKGAKVIIFSLFAICVLAFFAAQIPFVEKRIVQAKTEVVSYLDGNPGSAATSVGARLEQWSLAWRMGWDKPILGWGEHGYIDGRRQYVAEGKADPTVVNFGHSHNEFLNVFAKKGLVGVFGLILVYLAPILLFWPRKACMKSLDTCRVKDYKAVCLVGLSIPLAYAVFGLTEYFFYLNIGHIFYIFSIVYTYSLMKSTQEGLYV